jgi:hypothetical protein
VERARNDAAESVGARRGVSCVPVQSLSVGAELRGLRRSSGARRRDGLPGEPIASRARYAYGSSRLKYWLASSGANAWPNIEVKSMPSSSSPM